MTHPNLGKLLNPRSVAIVGPNDKGNPGARALQNIINVGFGGAIYPVNPNYDTIEGRKCYPSLAALPEIPDLVVSAVPVAGAMQVVRDAEAVGAPSMVLFCDGFIDIGTDEGIQRTNELKAIAERKAMAVQGPNCMGSMSLRHRFSSTFGKPPQSIKAGGISIVSQSGGLINAFLELGNARALGFNYLISGGNEAVVNAADYLEWLTQDSETQVIICIVEGVKDAARFRSALERAAREKPVVVLKLGRSEPGQRATIAHTGSLAGSGQIFAALCEQSGATLVDTVDQALETAAMFMRVRLPRGDKVVIFSTSGGATVLTTDLAAKLDLRFPPLPEAINIEMQRIFEVEKNFINPFDVTAQPRLARGNNMTRCLETLLADDTFDLIGCVLIIQRDGGSNDKLLDQVRTVAATASKPIILFPEATMHWREKPVDPGVHVASSLSDGLIALSALVKRAAFLRERCGAQHDNRSKAPPLTAWPDPRRQVLTEFESKKLLADAGLPITCEELARSAEEAVAAARRIGFPVALKLQSPDLMHKSDVGGLALGLAHEEDVRQAFQSLISDVAARSPNASIDGVLVQEMVSGAIEILVGMKRDPVFGPVVLVSPGGVFVELFEGAAQMRLPPLRSHEVEDMLRRSGAIEKLLGGFRGRPPADRMALVNFIAEFSRFVEGLSDDIVAIDLNPVMVLPQGRGVKIVDAAIECAAPPNA
jgi:acyl-CoA synthetase (NDP forming)